MKKFIFLISLIINFHLSTAQTDTSFWFAAPDISIDHGDRPVIFRFASFEKTTNIKISIPAKGLLLKELNLSPNSEGNFTITNPDIIEVVAGEIQNNGVLIQSNNPITSYYEVLGASGNNTDIYALKGKYALGNDFVIPMQKFYPNQYNINAFSSVTVIATQDNTTITFAPSSGIYPNNSSSQISVSLNKGQTYSFRAFTENKINKLTGSKITSDKPISVTSSDDSALSGGNWDLIGDQLIPFNYAGKKYVLPEGIIAVSSKNETSFSTLTDSYTLSASNNFSTTFYNDNPQLIDFSDTVIINYIDFISSSRGSELGGAILPPINCSGSREVSFIRSSDKPFFLYLVYRTSSKNNFRLNNTAFNFDNSLSTQLDSNLSFIKLPISNDLIQPLVSNRIMNSEAPFHLGIGNGSTNTGYQLGYFSNFKNEILDTIYVCEQYSNFEDYQKTLNIYGNISMDTLDNSKKDSTQVKFRVQDEYCVFEDSAWLIQASKPIFIIADTFKICNNIDSVITFNEHIVYFNQIQSNSKKTTIQGDSLEIYLENKAGCNNSKTIRIINLDSLKVHIPNDTFYCKNNYTEILIEGNFEQLILNSIIQTSNIFKISEDTTLNISVNNKCGALSKSIRIKENSLPVIDLGKNRSVCTKKLIFSLPNEYTYIWSDGQTTNNYEIFKSGTYSIISKNKQGCIYNDTVDLIIKSFDSIPPIHDLKICPNTHYLLDLNKGYDNYNWSDGKTDSIRVLNPGNYSLNVSSEDDSGVCYSFSATFKVSTWTLNTPNIITPNGDGKNETFVIQGMDKNYPLIFEVYNRWGNQIFKDTNYQNNWGHQDLSTGVYYFSTRVADFDCTKIKGYVLLEK